ncbi:Uncharacterized membrane protein [Geosporobacter subterraneus DSM 17957]|uniref:Uncharacterized membrane protein n=1 Tax=Geosporobacter subterraneus DSM 17957 TaxID=1121919 RepID=A0A1M6JGA1_9FIRM|nr:ECF transporter S component [Geosporobacter subterraneus]SHJ45721.1 Uncharacterized membrane protein [Geosporobacter subterraneus DSM 17957]
MKFSVRKLVMTGLVAALVMVGTMLIQVPTPTGGFIHIGDSMVYLSGILLGPLAGSIAAAMGSMLADLFSGYGVYAPATFVIKGLDALVVGYIYHKLLTQESAVVKKMAVFGVAVFLGGLIMIFGYLAYETILRGFAAAVTGIPGNITQAVGGGVLAAPLVLALERVKVFEHFKSTIHKV